MPIILIVDDRADLRRQVVNLTRLSIPKEFSEWTAEGIEPLERLDDYKAHITENDIAVLVLDEKLKEQISQRTKTAVDYDGHQLVKFLRPLFPELPIFVVTAFAQEQELQNAASDVEGIIPRAQFNTEPKTHTARMIRSGQRFSSAMQEDLIKLADLSKKVAVGEGSEDEIRELDGIREKLSLPFSGSDLVYAKELIPKAEKLLSSAQQLLDKLHQGRQR